MNYFFLVVFLVIFLVDFFICFLVDFFGLLIIFFLDDNFNCSFFKIFICFNFIFFYSFITFFIFLFLFETDNEISSLILSSFINIFLNSD